MIPDQITYVPIHTADIKINTQNILSFLGYKHQEPEEMVSVVINKYLSESIHLIHPKGGFIIKKIDHLDKTKGILLIDGKALHVNRIIASQLTGIEFIALFICTIGDKIEKLARKLMGEGDSLEGYTLDIIGSEAAEETAEIIHQFINKTANQYRYSITNRFSPGYCTWNVKEQAELFSFFPQQFSGITLTESALMSPIKSVSGIIGLGKEVKKHKYPCQKCKQTDCLYRNQH
ncbi:MAG: hypothetical protein JXJ22_03350 [Bacteroidales bacterium]|nr:hypothetical protein [Bacteroidales bacterium]